MQHVVDQGFAEASLLELVQTVGGVPELIARLRPARGATAA